MEHPQLVAVAHGTRFAPGNDVARELAAAAGEQLGWPSAAAFVELSEPLLVDVAAGLERAAVVVPLLLSTGYHVRVDLPEALARAAHPVALGTALGPDPLLARAQALRLREAEALPGQRVLMVAAGSNDEASVADLEEAADLLAVAWDGPVAWATLSGRGRRPGEVVQDGDVVSPYLLSPGLFVDRVREECAVASVVADVIGAHPLVVDLVVARAEELAAGLLED